MSEFIEEKRAGKLEWSAEELQMQPLWTERPMNFRSQDDTPLGNTVSSARWDEHKRRVIVRFILGFEYLINDVEIKPADKEVEKMHEKASMAWLSWYFEKLRRSRDVPGSDGIH